MHAMLGSANVLKEKKSGIISHQEQYNLNLLLVLNTVKAWLQIS
jgi:hypothetical protein